MAVAAIDTTTGQKTDQKEARRGIKGNSPDVLAMLSQDDVFDLLSIRFTAIEPSSLKAFTVGLVGPPNAQEAFVGVPDVVTRDVRLDGRDLEGGGDLEGDLAGDAHDFAVGLDAVADRLAADYLQWRPDLRSAHEQPAFCAEPRQLRLLGTEHA